MRLPHPSTHRDRRYSRGQSLVELALILPVMLLIVAVAIDFGRIYLGWVNMQNMARIAATYAANNPDGWPADVAIQARYADLIDNDAKAINCDLDGGVRDPIFASGAELGDLVEVSLACQFTILTPVISQILGGQVLVTSSAVAPVKAGFVANLPGGGGGPIAQEPEARFVASPTSGYAPLEVTFTDTSIHTPTSWQWSFSDAPVSLVRDPVHVFNSPGSYSVTLTVRNSAGSDTANAIIQVLSPPTTGPIPEFRASPRSGQDPLMVSFTDLSSGGPNTWLWDFGDGATDTRQNPNHNYSTPGPKDVSLTVSVGGGPASTQVKTVYIQVDSIPCRVPSFINTRKNTAQAKWSTAGFTTNAVLLSGQGNYLIRTQSLAGSTVPDLGCDAVIEVGP